MNSIKTDGSTNPDRDKKIQEQVIDRLTGMVVCWSRHIAGQKFKADAIQELRSGVADIAGWLDELEGLSHHGREQ